MELFDALRRVLPPDQAAVLAARWLEPFPEPPELNPSSPPIPPGVMLSHVAAWRAWAFALLLGEECRRRLRLLCARYAEPPETVLALAIEELWASLPPAESPEGTGENTLPFHSLYS